MLVFKNLPQLCARETACPRREEIGASCGDPTLSPSLPSLIRPLVWRGPPFSFFLSTSPWRDFFFFLSARHWAPVYASARVRASPEARRRRGSIRGEGGPRSHCLTTTESEQEGGPRGRRGSPRTEVRSLRGGVSGEDVACECESCSCLVFITVAPSRIGAFRR